MNSKLDVSVVLAVALGCATLSASANVKYAPEITNDWFKVTSENLGGATLIANQSIGNHGAWERVPTEDGAASTDTVGNKISLDTELSDPLVYSNTTEVVQSVYRIEATIKVTLSAELPGLGEALLATARTALCVYTDPEADHPTWWALVNGGWVNLGGTPAINQTYTIALDSDTVSSAIRYFAKTGGGEYVELTSGWTPNSESNVAIRKLAFVGSTELSYINGIDVKQGYADGNGTIYDNFDAAVENTTTGDVYTPVSTGGIVVASAKIDKTWMTENDAATVEGLNGNGENDIARWQSYVLGLNPKVASSKPVVQPEQDNNARTVSFSMGNVAVKSEAGVPVQYRVNTYNTPGATTPSASGVFVDSNQKASITLDPSGGVKYYKMEIKFGE